MAATDDLRPHVGKNGECMFWLDEYASEAWEPFVGIARLPFAEAKERSVGLGTEVLMTGASGFLGLSMLDCMLTNKMGVGELGVETIHVLIRIPSELPRTTIQEAGVDKLVRAASSFEITLDPSALNDLVNIVPADAFQPRFGVSDFMWDNLSSRVKTVLNFACETDYSKRYADIREMWATNLVNLCQWAYACGATLHHLGGCGALRFQDPEDFTTEIDWFCNGYFRLKWILNKIVTKCQARGLVGCGYDAPYIFGDVEHNGRHPGFHYTPWHIMVLHAAAGSIYEPGGYDFITANGIVELVLKNGALPRTEMSTYIRPLYKRSVDMNLLTETLAKYGYPVKQLGSQDEFLRHAIDDVGIPAKWFSRYFPSNKVEALNKIRQRSRPIVMPEWFNIEAHGSFEEVWDVNFKFIEKKFHRAVKKTAGYIEEANATKANKLTSKL